MFQGPYTAWAWRQDCQPYMKVYLLALCSIKDRKRAGQEVGRWQDEMCRLTGFEIWRLKQMHGFAIRDGYVLPCTKQTALRLVWDAEAAEAQESSSPAT